MGPIQSVEVSYLVHATEDAGKVSAAVDSLLGSRDVTKLEELEGHFGNSITKVSRRLTGEDASKAFAVLASKMSHGLRQQLTNKIYEHLDEHSAFYVRLDKQRLVEGELQLAEADPVRIRVKPRLHMVKGGAASMFSELLA